MGCPAAGIDMQAFTVTLRTQVLSKSTNPALMWTLRKAGMHYFIQYLIFQFLILGMLLSYSNDIYYHKSTTKYKYAK